MIKSFPLELAVSYLKTRRRQTIFSVLGVAIGVAFFIAIFSLLKGMHLFFIDKVINVSPHVIVKDEFRIPRIQPIEILFPKAIHAILGLKPKEDLRGIRNAQRIIKDLKKIKGANVAPVLEGQAFVRYGGKNESTSMLGIEPELERKVSNLEEDIIAGSLDRLLTTSNGLIVGEVLANKLSLKVGDNVSVVSPLGIQLNMKIVGIFSTGITQIDTFTSYALLKKVQILQNQENRINEIRLRLENVEEADSLARQIEDRYEYRTEGWEEMNKNVLAIFVIQNGIMYTTVLAILIVSGFGIFNIISTAVTEKAHDIAILKSMGFSEKDIQYIFLLQGIIIGIMGTLCGWLLGALLVEGLGMIRFKLEGEAFLRMEGFYLYKSIWQYLLAGFLALASTSASAFLPARKAAVLNPVDIIRGAV